MCNRLLRQTCLLQVIDENPQPCKDPETLAAAGKWMECEAFVKLMHKIMTQAQEWWHKTGSSMQAREVHDGSQGIHVRCSIKCKQCTTALRQSCSYVTYSTLFPT